MRKLAKSKLSLNKSTLRHLDARSMAHAVGGGPQYTASSGAYHLALEGSKVWWLERNGYHDDAALCTPDDAYAPIP